MQQIFSYMVSMGTFCCCVSSNSLLSSFCMTTLFCCVAFFFFQNVLFGCYNTTLFDIPSAVPSYRRSPFQTNLVNDAKNNYDVEIIVMHFSPGLWGVPFDSQFVVCLLFTYLGINLLPACHTTSPHAYLHVVSSSHTQSHALLL